jgi:large subunit ribosomal protein L21
MYAVIKTGGKQYRVASGDELRVEKINGDAGDTVVFDKVLLVVEGEDVTVGNPYLDGLQVVGKIVRHGKRKKVLILKYKRRKGYKRKRGHRQPFTLVRIENIKKD